MNTQQRLTGCDAEPIHVPGSIQPFGLMLVADAESQTIVGHAGLPETERLTGRRLADIIGPVAGTLGAEVPATGLHVIGKLPVGSETLDAVAFRTGPHLVVELTPEGDHRQVSAAFLSQLDALGASLDRSSTVSDLCRQAARIFQDLTGYGRVMIYRFVDDDAGMVIGESINDGSGSFLNHHFPASDIPKQARALYVRNRVRVIPDVGYAPQPIVGETLKPGAIDLSDSTLRSVSPVHIAYLKNMGVAASASMSIVKDGVLWGLVACHHHEPRDLSLTTRLACQAMATSLARQIKLREDGEFYRARVSLRSREEDILAALGSGQSPTELFGRVGADIARLFQANGFAAVQGEDSFVHGVAPEPEELAGLVEHVRLRHPAQPFATATLSASYAPGAAFSERASGVLAVRLPGDSPMTLLWFRPEQVQQVMWAGNPHKDQPSTPGAVLTPRASFDAWSESARGRSDDWTNAQIESAGRLARMLVELRAHRRTRQLNSDLSIALKENEALLQQKMLLMHEVNHRVQNSLAVVASFLRLQQRAVPDDARSHLKDAERRLMAVALVHRRLHQDERVEIVDLARYLESLGEELLGSMDGDWQREVQFSLAPVLIGTDRAVSVGLILNELLTNAAKYAYGGKAGPIAITLDQHRDTFRLVIADLGPGTDGETKGTGFGSRLVAGLVERLGGRIEQTNTAPGLSVTVTAPLKGA